MQEKLLFEPVYPALQAKYHTDEWKLPAQGEAYDTCGTVRAKAFCPECGEYKHELLDSCDRRECPTCHTKWANRAGKRIVERMRGMLDLLRSKNSRYRLSHVVLSPPEGSIDDLDRLFKELSRVRKLMGALGGVCIFHPFRFENKEGAPVPWKHCSLNPNAKTPIVESEAVWSPHWHLVNVGWLMPSNAVYEKTGWVYKNLGVRESKRELHGTILYLLTHAGINQTKHAYTYYGLSSYNKLGVQKTIEYQEVKCPDCETQLELHHLKPVTIDGHPVLGVKEQWCRKVINRKWFWRKRKCKKKS